jgi:hypothetical protein
MSSKKASVQTFENAQPIISVKPNKRECSIERIVSFFVTTDSVVATATVITDGETRSLEINWGDDEQDTLYLHDLNQTVIVFPISDPDPLPPNTYVFYHKYAVSYSDVRFGELCPIAQGYTVGVFAREKNGEFDWRPREITITPKYQINFYGLSVGNKDTCDNNSNEFTTVQTVGGEIRNQWDWISSNDFLFTVPTHRLDGSQLSQIFEVTENISPQPLIDVVSFSFTEHDRWYDETGSLYYPKNISFYRKDMEEYASGRLEGSIVLSDRTPVFPSSCHLLYSVGWEIKLLAPIPKYTWPVAIA